TGWSSFTTWTRLNRLSKIPDPARSSSRSCACQRLKAKSTGLSANLIEHWMPSSGVDPEVRGWEKTSDHAPTRIELADEPRRKRGRGPPGNNALMSDDPFNLERFIVFQGSAFNTALGLSRKGISSNNAF